MKTQLEIREIVTEKLKDSNLTKVQVEEVIKNFIETLKEDLCETGKAKILGIGTLEIRYRGAREGKNPKTKEVIQINESLSAGLKVSSLLKTEIADKVNIDEYRK